MANGNKQARPRGAHLRGGCCSQRKAWRRAKRARAKAPPRSIGVIYCSPGKAVKKRSAQSLRAAVHLLPAVFTVTSPRSSSPPFNRRRSYATAGRKKHLAASLSMQAREPPARCDPLVRCTEAPRIKREQLSALTLRRITPEYHYANPGLVVSPRPTHQDSWLISEGTLRGASEEARDEDPNDILKNCLYDTPSSQPHRLEGDASERRNSFLSCASHCHIASTTDRRGE